ncbi:MAG: hypothetical protein AAF989_14835 [Planctomycetota bacterium]
MSAETHTAKFDERILRQARLDSLRALVRARYCNRRSESLNLRCVDRNDESERQFGRQLWFFEGVGVDEDQARRIVFGVIEYSVQYGLMELVDDGVFESQHERERFRSLYEHEHLAPSWRQPAHRWLAAGVTMTAALTFAALIVRTLLSD